MNLQELIDWTVAAMYEEGVSAAQLERNHDLPICLAFQAARELTPDFLAWNAEYVEALDADELRDLCGELLCDRDDVADWSKARLLMALGWDAGDLPADCR